MLALVYRAQSQRDWLSVRDHRQSQAGFTCKTYNRSRSKSNSAVSDSRLLMCTPLLVRCVESGRGAHISSQYLISSDF